MATFTPKVKLSKKAQKALNSERRATWGINPVTRTATSKKIYNRKKKPCDQSDDDGAGLLF